LDAELVRSRSFRLTIHTTAIRPPLYFHFSSLHPSPSIARSDEVRVLIYGFSVGGGNRNEQKGGRTNGAECFNLRLDIFGGLLKANVGNSSTDPWLFEGRNRAVDSFIMRRSRKTRETNRTFTRNLRQLKTKRWQNLFFLLSPSPFLLLFVYILNVRFKHQGQFRVIMRLIHFPTISQL